LCCPQIYLLGLFISDFQNETYLASSFLLALPLAASAQTRSTDTVDIASRTNGGRVLASTSTLDNDKAYDAANLIDGTVWTGPNSKTRGWASNKFDPITRDSVTIGFAGNRVVNIGKLILNPPPTCRASDGPKISRCRLQRKA
jgi:hypothetical protein